MFLGNVFVIVLSNMTFVAETQFGRNNYGLSKGGSNGEAAVLGR